jgi:hypothetical protein
MCIRRCNAMVLLLLLLLLLVMLNVTISRW